MNHVDSRFWVTPRLGSSASGPPGVDSLQISFGIVVPFPILETNCFRPVTRRITSFPEVEIISLALTREIIPLLHIFEGDYSLSQGSVNALNSLALLCLKQQR